MAEEHILVDDDEPDILSILVYQLSREGFRVSTAVNGQSAIAAAIDDPPDLLVLDLMLPVVGGYAVPEEAPTQRANGDGSGAPPHRTTGRGGAHSGTSSTERTITSQSRSVRVSWRCV